MLVSWILGGMILGAVALSAILRWWNEIVEWVEDTFAKFSSAVTKAWSYITIKAGELIAYIMKIFGSDVEIEQGQKILIESRDQLVELAREGRIPWESIDILWKGKPFTITVKN